MGTVYGSSRELGSGCRVGPVQRQHRGRTRSVACGSGIQLKMSVLCCAATTRVPVGQPSLPGLGKSGGPGFRVVAVAKHVGILRIGPLVLALIRVRQRLASPLPDQSRPLSRREFINPRLRPNIDDDIVSLSRPAVPTPSMLVLQNMVDIKSPALEAILLVAQ